WRVDVSARTFSALVGQPDAVKIEDTLGSYLLSYENAAAGSPVGLRRATLRLNKVDSRATQMSLVVEREGEAREYRFIETAYGKRGAGEIMREIIEAGEARRGAVEAGAPAAAGEGLKLSEKAAPASLARAGTIVASAELEIEVIYLLDQIKANLDEQVSMARTAGGML